MQLFADLPPATLDPADPDEQRALVALSLIPGIGTARLRALVDALGSARAVRGAPARRLAAVDGIGRQTAEAVAAWRDEAAVDRQFALADRAGARLVSRWDPAYPVLLARSDDPPPLLWVRGRLTPDDAHAVAVVGTRKATDYGRRAATHLAGALAERGFTVVSGLAYGIDVAAHRGALDAGGRTLAVLGSGVDRIYPHAHAALVRRLLEHDQGAVVSELPMGTAPEAGHFPRRNRIVAGLALGTVVAEARAHGGALLTAMIALELNREVFAVPAPMFSEMDGTNALIRRGFATLVASADDVVAELLGPMGAAPAATPAPPPDLVGDERTLYDALAPEPIGLDALCEATGLDPATALVSLLGLEFKGLVRQLAGKQFFRA